MGTARAIKSTTYTPNVINTNNLRMKNLVKIITGTRRQQKNWLLFSVGFDLLVLSLRMKRKGRTMFCNSFTASQIQAGSAYRKLEGRIASRLSNTAQPKCEMNNQKRKKKKK